MSILIQRDFGEVGISPDGIIETREDVYTSRINVLKIIVLRTEKRDKSNSKRKTRKK